MTKKLEKMLRKVVRHFYRTAKNKLCALIMLAIGLLSLKLSDDGTAFVFLLIFFVIPLTFARENYID